MFQLTTSRRGRRSVPSAGRQQLRFNSRPHEEVDALLFSYSGCFLRFNSRPHEEVDEDLKSIKPDLQMFQLTTSRRGRHTPGRSFFSPTTSFNSRPHEEVDMMDKSTEKALLVFQLTTSRRGRLISLDSDVISMAFQLTTSRRGRHRKGLLSRGGCCFNSRPHEEVDKYCLGFMP